MDTVRRLNQEFDPYPITFVDVYIELKNLKLKSKGSMTKGKIARLMVELKKENILTSYQKNKKVYWDIAPKVVKTNDEPKRSIERHT